MRRVWVAVLGTLLIVVGVALCFLPGPGLLVIIAGLAVLATEFLWARRLRNKAIVKADEALDTAPRAQRALDAIPGVDVEAIRQEEREQHR